MRIKPIRETEPFAFADVRGHVTTLRAGGLTSPVLSLIMPCFGDVEFNLVDLAVNSILTQAFTAFELIALTDANRGLAAQLNWRSEPSDPRLIELEVSGPSAALRAVAYGQALRRCRGEYIVVFPSAAVLRDNALGEIAAAASRRPEPEFCYFGAAGFVTEPARYDLMLRDNLLREAALLVPRSGLAGVGLPDPHVALSRHFLWDWALRLLEFFPGIRLSPSRPFIERYAPLLDDALNRPETEESMERAIARRMMANNRCSALSPENWHARPVAAVDEAVLPGLAHDEHVFLQQRVRHVGLTTDSHATAAAEPPLSHLPSSLRVTILATCNYLDTANVFIEQPLLEIARGRPLHYRLVKAKDASEADIRDTDLLLLSRTLFEGWERALQLAAIHKERRRQVVFVMDDDLLDLPRDVVINEAILVAQRFAMFLPCLDGMIVALPYLQERMQARFPELPIYAMDNSCCVPHAPAQRRKEPRLPGEIRVALTLTSSAQLRVRAFADGLHSLPVDVRDSVQLHVFGETGPVRDWLPFAHKVCHRYLPYLEYLALLSRLQLDLAWIPLPGDHDFYRCKTAVKYYEFAGLGIPGIYSRVPIYEAAIRHGESGWLVNNTSDEWSEAITRLVVDVPLRERLGAAARHDSLTNHSIRRAADEWWRLLQLIASAPPLQLAA